MTASQVFVATAVSQSGRLDTFLVLSLQTRMVWKIARGCTTSGRRCGRWSTSTRTWPARHSRRGRSRTWTSPSRVEPVFSAVIGSLGGAVPGFQLVASILANSVLSGAARRVPDPAGGDDREAVLRRLVVEQPATLRRKATSEAAEHLGAIVAEGTARITRALWSHSKDKVGGAAKDAYSRLLTVFDRIKQRGQAEAPV